MICIDGALLIYKMASSEIILSFLKKYEIEKSLEKS